MIPFWSLNDRLEEAELTEQIQRMHEVGIDGFFLHARGGLETAYMSEEWIARMETCIRKADELGMQAWLYDENGWPSGFADGAVPARDVRYQQKKLKWATLQDTDHLPHTLLGVYRITDGRVHRVVTPEPGLLAVWYEANPYYVDVLCKDATLCFIQHTHEQYYQRLKPYFDGRIKGFFTDEPQYARGDLPWSDSLRGLWRERYGEDMVEGLPLLFTEAEGAATYRYRYFTLAAHLVAHHYLKPLYEWCEAHNCALTGHMMLEDTMTEQIAAIGAAMPCYEFFQMPGIDFLCRLIRNPLLPKQLGSVAQQLGRPTITETFAGCGWDVSLQQLKWIGQSQFVHGVTGMCQHLQGYTLRGLRKRDWPASLFIQQPWFDKAYRPFNEYFTRLGAVLSQGEDAAQVLLLHPIRSAYMVYNPTDKMAVNKADAAFLDVVQTLCDRQVMYHIGDEEIMERHGQVTADGLRVGGCTYHTVVLPDMITLSEPVFRLLLAFAQAGGTVLALGDLPTCLDGVPDARLAALTALIRAVDIPALKGYSNTVTVTAQGAPCAAIHANVRRLPHGNRVYLANMTEQEHAVTVTLSGHLRVRQRDLVTETYREIPTVFTETDTVLTTTFAPGGDLLLETAPATSATMPSSGVTVTLPLSDEMTLSHLTDNALTLDYCRYRIDNGAWQPAAPVLKVQQECIAVGHACDVSLAFDFEVSSLSDVSTMAMAVECPETFTFRVNGQRYTFCDTGYYVDKSFRLSDIRPLLREGSNTIEMTGRFTQSEHTYYLYANPDVHESEWNRLTLQTELESIYLVGRFGVTSDQPPVYINLHMESHTMPRYGRMYTVHTGRHFTVGGLPQRVHTADLTVQGLWFFAGEAGLTQTLCVQKQNDVRYEVRLTALYAPAARVFVNGEDAGELAFAPFVLDVTPFVKDGENTVEIRLYSGLRNLLGPHHIPVGDHWVTSPGNFTTFDVHGRDNRGLGWTDDYRFARFGFEG